VVRRLLPGLAGPSSRWTRPTLEAAATTLSGHRTRAILDRYDVTSEADLVVALERRAAYVTERAARGRHVVPLRARVEPAQGRHSGVPDDELQRTGTTEAA
jgi:hypothetical protein